jgi:hypothetical protein
MRLFVMGLLTVAVVSLSASPVAACHHRHRGCEGGCGCSSGCGCASTCSSGCSSGCTAANLTAPSYAASGPVYAAPVASVGRWQPTPPAESPTDPRANLASAQSGTTNVGK